MGRLGFWVAATVQPLSLLRSQLPSRGAKSRSRTCHAGISLPPLEGRCPEGAEGLFEIYHAPADTFETVNTLGLPLYARTIPDRDRDEWVRLEIESNPLPICTRPQVLRSARRT